jgi:DNA ligase 1
VKFLTVAQTFTEIEPIASRLEMTRLLADLLKKATPSEAAIICYFSLGQLQPPHIGTKFNIAEKMAIKAVAELLKSEPKVVEHEMKQIGDLGLVVLNGGWHARQELTVHEVYKRLEEIESIAGAGSQEEKIVQLKDLLHDLDPVSAKYVIRIILDTLRLGFSDMTIIDALSWMISGDKSLRSSLEDAYNICADIGLIARTVKEEGIEAIEKMHIHLGVPIRPAAAERLPNAQAIIEKIGHCIAQPKIDGFRLQIHVDNTRKPAKIHFFSRNLQDMSAMFPDLTEAVKTLDVESVICEGEAIAYDPVTDSFLPFQETVKRKRKHGIEAAIEEFPLRVFLFDLLYLNGKDLLKEPCETRRNHLMAITKNSSDLIKVIGEQEINNAQELEDYFNENIAAGLEGVVVKRAYSQYTPGKRNFNWIKLKRQEEPGHLEDTLDCVILGYYSGSGKRAGFGIGAFLVGLFNAQEDRYETVAKIGTGLKDEDWVELKKRCDKIAVSHQPKNVVCAKELVPDVWVYPEIVCMVRADEITISPLHAAGKTVQKQGYALRFPRFMGYRPDKSASEATTVKELEHLFKNQTKR